MPSTVSSPYLTGSSRKPLAGSSPELIDKVFALFSPDGLLAAELTLCAGGAVTGHSAKADATWAATWAVVDATLSGQPPAFDAATHDAMSQRQQRRQTAALGPTEIAIDNFQFAPPTLNVKPGSKVTWINKDDVPHLIVNVQQRFKASGILDTDQRYSATLTKLGTYDYFCSLHPKMQGKIVVSS